MFQKLRLKLTLINVSIILVLFLLLIVSTYGFANINISNRIESIANKIMADIQADIITDLPLRRLPPGISPGRSPAGEPQSTPPGSRPAPPPGMPPGPNFFFVKTTATGEVIFQSSGQPHDAEQLKVLTDQVLQTASPQGTITIAQTDYFYLQAPLLHQPGQIILFHDLAQETGMLRTVLTALLAVGAVCAILSFGASFYMANRAMTPIKQAWQQQNDFLSDASHELRTPLTVIQTNLEIVRESPDETVASQSKWLDNIQEESICMMNLINSLLFLARADSAQQPLHKEPFALSMTLLQAAAPFEAVAIRKKIFLDVSSLAAPVIVGDEARIKQVIAILLDNGLRHTPPGGKLLAALSQSEGKAVLTITDSGEGIAPEHWEKIFDRFYQVDKSRNKGGSGLGLSIARWIIENHGGTIAVTSTPGEGTTFTVRLPAHPDR
ncbi:sensor histidine kinase [Sporomusa sphaeroides]|uniref:histidine kinase n=1 Tax=Sporomusa sphaeroides DSM 2875 TaxID=1337886 RepID=A0ABP2C3Z9_9FIRM|nr:ATP-binding protein [Sporomusa sphaeroides]OLS57057.1 sensor protein SrrB [Sporomusa sphaeroides DSM 2875]CVK18243.1 Sensor protein SrrB [Sporomusa sphaeroides DSM 2875]